VEASVNAIMTQFVTQTSAADETLIAFLTATVEAYTDTATYTLTPSNTPTPSPTSTITLTPTETSLPTDTATKTPPPTATIDQTITAQFQMTQDTQATNQAQATLNAQATNQALAIQNAPTNTPVPTNIPTATLTNTPTSAPSSTLTNTPTVTPKPTSTNTPTSTASYTPTDTPIPTNTPTSTPAPTDTPTPNIKATQDANSTIVAQAQIDARSTQAAQQTAQQNARETITAQPTLNPEITPTIEATPEVTSEVAISGNCTVQTDQANTVTVRVGPGENRGAIMYLPTNQPFKILGQATANDGSLWWELDKQEVAPDRSANEVWIAQNDVSANGSCNNIEVVEAPPIIGGASISTNGNPNVTVSGGQVIVGNIPISVFGPYSEGELLHTGDTLSTITRTSKYSVGTNDEFKFGKLSLYVKNDSLNDVIESCNSDRYWFNIQGQDFSGLSYTSNYSASVAINPSVVNPGETMTIYIEIYVSNLKLLNINNAHLCFVAGNKQYDDISIPFNNITDIKTTA
jgi:hypothetical protein